MDKYLISTLFYETAIEISKEMKLMKNQWIWIPFGTGRKKKIFGRRVSDKKYLVGDFSREEIKYLIYPRSK